MAAGYVVYGASTVLVYTVGNGVHGFTLDPAIGAYVLTHENIRMPQQGKYYSVNEANRDSFPPAYNRFLDGFAAASWARDTARATSASWSPIFIARCSKGASFCIRRRQNIPGESCGCCTKPTRSPCWPNRPAAGHRRPAAECLEIQPDDIHQRTPLLVGSLIEMTELARCLAAG